MKEDFTNGLNDDGMIVDIIYELTSVNDMVSVTSEHILAWAEIIN